MQRVAVVGSSGAGKTWLATRLAAALNVRHVELDAIHHGPGWAALPAEAMRRELDLCCPAAGAWVADGNYQSKGGDLVRDRADTVVWLAFPRAAVMRQLVVHPASLVPNGMIAAVDLEPVVVMVSGGRTTMVSKRIEVGTEDRAELERVVRSRRAERRMVERAEVVLAAADGLPAREIAARVGCSEKLAGRWRARYEREGLDGLMDRPRSGRPLTHEAEPRALLIAKACARPPDTPEGRRRERWTHRELGDAVGMSESRAHVILSRAEIKPHRTECWVMTDFDQPHFEEQAGEVCGLYLDPPANALVLSIDEKASVRAKGLARPDTPAEPGKSPRRDYEHARNGTMNLFAALRVHSGEAHATASKTRNRFDFICFLDQIDQAVPQAEGQEIVAITDDLSTHTSHDVEDWLRDHPRWRFAFAPNHASWLNQVECLFSTLARRLLEHGRFDTPEDLAEQMLAFVETHNQTATPFDWTYTGKVLGA